MWKSDVKWYFEVYKLVQTLIFLNHKNIFFENWGSKNDPNMLFSVTGSKIALGAKKVPSIWGRYHIVQRFGGQLNMVKFWIWKAKNAWKISVTSAWTSPKCTPKNFRPWSILWKKNLHCAIKIRWDIFKNFWLFFFSLMVSIKKYFFMDLV